MTAGADPRLPIRLTVNGQAHDLGVEPRRMLIDVLREDLDLTGTKIGCDTSQCGACMVLLDGQSAKACTVLAVQADGREVATIEGVAAGRPWGPALEPGLHPMQAAFVEHHGLQCGFCTPGMIISALDLVSHAPEPTDDQIRATIHGNLCRCTGYQSIVESIRVGASAMRAEGRADAEAAASGPAADAGPAT